MPNMIENWQDCFVADIASPVRNALVGGPFGSNLVTKDYVAVGIPVIRGQNMGDRWISGEFVFVSNEKAKQLSPNTSRPGDLIFTQRGTLGQVAIVPEQPYEAFIISQSQMKLTVDKEKADALFMYYLFKSPEQQDYILRNAIQTGVPHTNLEHLRTTPLFLPTLPEQRAIAGILGALDDKIELNRQMNRTIESMARAVFREWFVVSEEVRKWKIGYLSDIAYIVKGVSYRSVDLVEDSDTALVTLKSMERGGGYKEDGLKPFAGEYKIEQKLFPGEVVIAHTDLTQAADVIGRAARIETSEKHPNLVASLDMAIVRPKEKPYSNEYLYGLLSQLEFSDHAYGYTNGTTVLHLSTKALPEYQFRIPPKNKVDEFSKLISPIFLQIDNNKKQSRMLTSLRDTLLPKLMRGEVRVGELQM